ncbi:MAG: A/G-specific adenine glycosylase [Acidimicrobiaceae bacterium]|nr:A/G-specific adenine glycosylase [Acidimicrobiaceae bacterium]
MASESQAVSDLTGDVLAWGVPRLRDLPWRHTRDAWAVLVSEVMLQQTQVGRVIPRWYSFLDRFPTPATCAAAPLGDVLREWQGLGYPRRARNLHATAQQVTELGGFPRDLDGLLALPGIGPYTARAVMAFAFELDAAVVDTNIARVYARVAGERLTPKRVQSIADDHCPSGDAWVWNQCLMDLGAVLCRPRDPACGDCPIRKRCGWHGDPERPDPAVGSSGVSGKQAPFEGSDRQARGRLMKALGNGPVGLTAVAAVMQRDDATAERLVTDLVRDGLCCTDGVTICLPT